MLVGSVELIEKMAWAVENEGKCGWQTDRKQTRSRETGDNPEAQRTALRMLMRGKIYSE